MTSDFANLQYSKKSYEKCLHNRINTSLRFILILWVIFDIFFSQVFGVKCSQLSKRRTEEPKENSQRIILLFFSQKNIFFPLENVEQENNGNYTIALIDILIDLIRSIRLKENGTVFNMGLVNDAAIIFSKVK